MSNIGPTFESLLDRFLDYLLLDKGLSRNTQSAYRNDLRRYFVFLEERGISEISRTRTQDVRDLIVSMSRMGIAASSLARSVSSLRMFYRYLMGEGILTSDPTVNVDVPKMGRKLPVVLEIYEIERLLDQPDLSQPKGLRDRALLEFMYATGVRVSEAVTLAPTDLNEVEGFVRVLGKGSKESDELLRRFAKGHDIWIHTKDVPGSHVIIHPGSKNASVSQNSILDGAHLAAYYSKARDEKVVPLYMTEVKNLRHPRKSKPGKVIVGNDRGFAVRIEDTRLESLLGGRRK